MVMFLGGMVVGALAVVAILSVWILYALMKVGDE